MRLKKCCHSFCYGKTSDVPTLVNTINIIVSPLIRIPPSSHPTSSVAIQRVSLDEPVSSAAARSQTFIVLCTQRWDKSQPCTTDDMSGD